MELNSSPAPANAAGALPEAEHRAVTISSRSEPETSASESTEQKAEAKQDAKPEEQKPTGREFAALKRQRQRAEQTIAQAKQAETVIQRADQLRAAFDAGDVEKVFELAGVSGDKIVDLYLKYGGQSADGEEPKADDPVARKLSELEQKLAAKEQREQAQQIQAVVQQHIGDLQTTAIKDADRYELVNAESAYDLAFDVMVEYHRANNVYLTTEQALDAVEAHLVDQRKAELARLTKLKKLGRTSQSGDQPAASPAVKWERKESDPIREAFLRDTPRRRVTVSNSASSAAPTTTSTPKVSRGELADRRFREKVAALRGRG